jgi:hypothetical protein
MTDEERVRALLGQAFEVDPPSSARPDIDAVRTIHRRRRVAASVGTTALATVGVVAAAVVPGLGGGRPVATPVVALSESAYASPSVAGSAYPPVLEDGQTVGATGRVAAVPGQPVRFCMPVDVDAVGYSAGHEPAPTGCALGVDVTGVNLGTLSQRREKDGAVEGWAYLRGVYRAGTLSVTLQAEQRDSGDPEPSWTTPPCPRPAQGWRTLPRGSNPMDQEDRVQAFKATNPQAITNEVIFRPTGTTAVVVLTVSDVTAAHAALGPNGPGLCIGPSRFTAEELQAAEQQLIPLIGKAGTGVYQGGVDSGEDGQPYEVASVVQVTQELDILSRALPDGLLTLRPWLQQVAQDAPLPPPVPTPALDPSPFLTATS